MSNELATTEKAPLFVVPNPVEYGIEETKARQIVEVFTPMLDQLKSYEQEYNELILQEPSKENSKLCRELRLRMVKSRTAMIKEHKQLKDFYIKGGNFVDGMRKTYEFGTHNLEEKLDDREKHFENLEKEKRENLRLTRLADIKEFEGSEPVGLADMDEEQFNTYMVGVKATHELRKKQQEEAEKERERSLAILKLASERTAETRSLWVFLHEDEADIKLGELSEEEYFILKSTLIERRDERAKELEKLRKEKEEAEAKAQEEAMQRAKVEKEAEENRIAIEAKAKAEAQAAEEKARQEAEVIAAKAEEQRRIAKEATDKAEAEAKKAKDELDRKIKQEEQEKETKRLEEEKTKSLGDIPKYKAMLAELLTVAKKYEFSSEKAKESHEKLMEAFISKTK